MVLIKVWPTKIRILTVMNKISRFGFLTIKFKPTQEKFARLTVPLSVGSRFYKSVSALSSVDAWR